MNYGTLLKESKGISSDAPKFTNAEESGIASTESLPDVLNQVLNDPELRSFIGIQRDAITRSGYTLLGSDSAVKKGYKKLRSLKFRKLIKRVTSDLLIFKHAFVEIQKSRSGTEVTGLKAMDPTTIRPVKDVWDNILFWYQHTPSVDADFIRNNGVTTKTKDIAMNILSTQEIPLWDLDEMAHLSIDETTSTFWGVTDIHTLKQINEIDNALMNHIQLLFKQNWFRVHFHAKNISPEDYGVFLDQMKTNMEYPEDPLLTAGAEDLEGKKYVEESVLLPIIEMRRDLRNQKLTMMRIPPIIAGTVDNSNRSNSDVQAHYAFNNRIRAVQEDMEDDIEFELLKKINIQNVEFKFNEVSNRSLREIVDIMMLFIGQGADPKKMSEWAKEKGYDIPADVWEMLNKVEVQEGQTGLPPNSDLQPSRKPQDNANSDGFGTQEGSQVEGQKQG